MRYKNKTRLGAGGKAEVFRALDGNMHREVALKILRPELMELRHEQQSLVREARTMAAMRHLAIPEVYDLGRDGDGRPYYAMSLRTGPTLHEVLSQLRTGDLDAAADFTLERLVGLLVDACDALHYAHEMNVVHCDVKPQNLVIGPRDSVSLIDWGLALVHDFCPDGQAPRDRRQEQGSPLYMSPEQGAGDPTIGPASDVYSLGAVIYECLTLDTPCRGATLAETLRQVIEDDPVPPREAAPERRIPYELERVCLRALAKRPDDRFATMAELRRELHECRLDLLARFERDVLCSSAG